MTKPAASARDRTNTKSKATTPAKRQGSRTVAAARQAQQRRTRNYLIAVAAVVVVGVLVVAIVLNRPSTGSSTTGTTVSAADAATIIAKATSVPASVFDEVGAGTVSGLPKPVSGTALNQDGKPELLFIGAEYCPYCATERWAMVLALSRFGTFKSLRITHSSSIDSFPNTPTFSFHGTSYSSQYLVFTAVETNTNIPQGGTYAPLDTPTAEEAAAMAELDPGRGIPFLDFAGRYLVSGVTYDPAVLQGHSALEVANVLADANTAISQGAVGAANAITAAICKLTGGKPSSVCASAGVSPLLARM